MVEDSDEETELVIRELRRGGYDVSFERVDTPQAMSATLENRAWDVVICDFSLSTFQLAPMPLSFCEKQSGHTLHLCFRHDR
jgi:CheY-like chemotaxis protein